MTTAWIILLLVALICYSVSHPQYPQYPFPYASNNPYQPQPRQPQIIEGSYTFIDPTGAKRTVKYTNGPEGFNTVVEQDATSTEKPDDKNSTTPSPDTAKKPEEKVKYVPIPVYPPVVSSRSFGYGGFVPSNGYQFRNSYGFQNPYGK